MYPLIIAACCLLGSVISGTLGWMKSGGPFVPREFLTTVLSGVGGALLFALAYQYSGTGLTTLDILGAISGGMAADVTVNRVSGAISARAARASK